MLDIHVRTQWDNRKWTRRWALTRHWLYGHLDLQNCEKNYPVYGTSVTAAHKDWDTFFNMRHFHRLSLSFLRNIVPLLFIVVGRMFLILRFFFLCFLMVRLRSYILRTLHRWWMSPPQDISWSHKMSIYLSSHVDFDYSDKLFGFSTMQLLPHNW